MRSSRLLRWLNRTPVQTFILCPLLVVAFELARQRGRLVIMPAGFALLAWGYLQYLLVGRFRSRLGASQRERLHTADVLKDLQLPREIAGEPLFEGEWK